MSKRSCWDRHIEFSRGRPWAVRGPKNPKWWLIYSKFSTFSSSYHSKRWDEPLKYITNSNKLHDENLNMHTQKSRLMQLYAWFVLNPKCRRPNHQYLPREQYPLNICQLTLAVLINLILETSASIASNSPFPTPVPCSISTWVKVKRKYGPAVFKRGNLVPWSAPVARVHPRTSQHCYLPYLGHYETPKTMSM